MLHKNGQGKYQIDFKEVFHLANDQIPIEEVKDMELVPQIESRATGDTVEIVGKLILFGNYSGNQDAGKIKPVDELPESFEESVTFEPFATERGSFSPFTKQDRLKYQIPIQITLPKQKVKNIDEIYTYVSSFDYEIRTPHEIEVTASLIIGGLVDDEERQVDHKGPEFEPMEFVFMSGQSPSAIEGSSKESNETPSEDHSIVEDEAQVEVGDHQDYPRDELSEKEQSHEGARVPEIEAAGKKSGEPELLEQVDQIIESEAEHNVSREDKGSVTAPVVVEEDAETVLEQSVIQSVEESNKQQDMRIGISQKSESEPKVEEISPLSHFFANRRSAREKTESDQKEELQKHEEEQLDPNVDQDATYLGNFMEDAEEQFTKVKICIIQKDETIDEIAERYELSVDMILRSNEADRTEMTAGQLLYIPVKG